MAVQILCEYHTFIAKDRIALQASAHVPPISCLVSGTNYGNGLFLLPSLVSPKLRSGCGLHLITIYSDHFGNFYHLNKNSYFYQNPREASSQSRIFLFSLVIYMSVGWWFERDLLAKRKTIQTWNLNPPLDHIKNVFFFSKKWPWGSLASKNYRVTGFPAYLLDCLVFVHF